MCDASRKFATAFVSELVDVLAVPGRCPSVAPHIRLSSSPASTPTARPSSPPRPALPNPCVHPPLPPSSLPATLVFSSGVPVLDQGSNIAPNQAKNITHVSKLCRIVSFHNHSLLFLSLQIFHYLPPRRPFNNPSKSVFIAYYLPPHALSYHLPSPPTRSFLSSLFSSIIGRKSRVQALFNNLNNDMLSSTSPAFHSCFGSLFQSRARPFIHLRKYESKTV